MLSFEGEGGRNPGIFWNGLAACCREGDKDASGGSGGTGGSSSSALPSARKNWLLPERALTAESGGEGELKGLDGVSSCTPFA
jgi:hypothetical protein